MIFQFKVNVPFSFERVVKTHGWFQLIPFYWNNDAKELTWAAYFSKPALLHFQETSRTEEQTVMRCRVDKATLITENEIIAKFYHVFNLHWDLTDFYNSGAHYPILKNAKPQGMGRLMHADSLFEDVFKSICGTNVQWKQAVGMINNIARLGESYENTPYHTFPKPKQILDAGDQFLKDTGRVGYRSSYLIELCEQFVNEPSLENTLQPEMSYADMTAFFAKFKGIGKITARYLCALYGRFDELSVDSLVLSYMSKTHFNGIKPTPQQVQNFYAEFGQWKYLAYWMEFILNKGWDPDAG